MHAHPMNAYDATIADAPAVLVLMISSRLETEPRFRCRSVCLRGRATQCCVSPSESAGLSREVQ
jgi:hypothetical protein